MRDYKMRGIYRRARNKIEVANEEKEKASVLKQQMSQGSNQVPHSKVHTTLNCIYYLETQSCLLYFK